MSDAGPRPVDWDAIAATLQSVWIVAFCVVNVLNAVAILTGDFDNAGFRWVLLDSESNPSTWFSAVVLLVAGAAALLCRLVDRPVHERFWALVGGLLVAMSFEEVSQVHELVSGNLGSETSVDLPEAAWVVPGALLVVVAVVLVLAWAPRGERELLFGLAAGTAIFVVGAFGFELVNSENLLFRGQGSDIRRVFVITSIEENLELVAGLILARTVVKHVLRIGRAPADLPPAAPP